MNLHEILETACELIYSESFTLVTDYGELTDNIIESTAAYDIVKAAVNQAVKLPCTETCEAITASEAGIKITDKMLVKNHAAGLSRWCSNCREYLGYLECMMPNYCPNCGRRVI